MSTVDLYDVPMPDEDGSFTDIEELLQASTRVEYENDSAYFEEVRNRPKVSVEEIERRQAEVAALNEEATEAAIIALLGNHPAEFESLLYSQRKARKIETEVESPLYDYLQGLN